MKALVLFAWLAGLSSAQANIIPAGNSNAEQLAQTTYEETAQILQHWTVLGPFFQQEEEDLWDKDFFRVSGSSAEKGLTAEFLEFAQKLPVGKKSETIKTPHLFAINDGGFVDLLNLFGRPYFAGDPPSSAYAACEISCLKAADIILMIGSSDAEKVWVNGNLLHDASTRRGINTYDEALPIHLNRGANFLLLKIHRWNTIFGFTARLEPTTASAALTALRGQGMMHGLLLKQSVLAVGEALEIAPRGVPREVMFPVTITKPNGDLVAEIKMTAKKGGWLPGQTLVSGVYEATLDCGGERFMQPFVIGNPSEIAANLSKRCSPFAAADRIAINLEALRRRAQILTRAPNGDSRTIAYTLESLEKTLLLLEAGKEAFRDVTGLSIRGFRSRIDDQIEHYRLFVPSSYRRDGAKLPLVLILPTSTSADRPFIESVPMAAHSEAERMSVIAERLGIALLWTGFRTRITGQPCEFAHLDESLNAVTADYNIDPEKISLCGACSGGAVATMAVVRWPERFSGVALLSPVFLLNRNLSFEDMSPFVRCAPFRSLMGTDNGAIDAFLSRKNPPTYIIHDGAEPGHGELPVSLDFAARAETAGYPLTFEQKSRTLQQHFGAWDDLLSWLSRQRRVKPSCRVDPAYFPSPSHTGPIAQAFAKRFVVVKGTGGNESDRAETDRLANEFQDSWRQMHYGPCRIIADSDFDETAEHDANVVVIGNNETNAVWRRFAPLLPIKLEPGRVGLKGRHWDGEHLAVQAIFALPDDPDRQIVLVGSKNLTDSKFGTLNLSVKGWFSFAVWNTENLQTRLVEADVW